MLCSWSLNISDPVIPTGKKTTSKVGWFRKYFSITNFLMYVCWLPFSSRKCQWSKQEVFYNYSRMGLDAGSELTCFSVAENIRQCFMCNILSQKQFLSSAVDVEFWCLEVRKDDGFVNEFLKIDFQLINWTNVEATQFVFLELSLMRSIVSRGVRTFL